jgi:hypothetical protein
MNIFYLDDNPEAAARMMCDKHVVKMVLETAQILSAVCDRHGVTEDAGYRVTHRHHPCTVWAGDSVKNFDWTVAHGRALAAEYTRRYGKTHKSLRVIDLYARHRGALPDVPATDPAQAMPEECRIPGEPVAAYRRYYRDHKQRVMAVTYKAPASPPTWLHEA